MSDKKLRSELAMLGIGGKAFRAPPPAPSTTVPSAQHPLIEVADRLVSSFESLIGQLTALQEEAKELAALFKQPVVETQEDREIEVSVAELPLEDPVNPEENRKDDGV